MHCFPPILVRGYAKALQLQLWENQTGNLGASTITAARSPYTGLFIVEMCVSGQPGSLTLQMDLICQKRCKKLGDPILCR